MTTATRAPIAAGAAGHAAGGADLQGWSALPLLGRAAPSDAPWLFVATGSHSVLSSGPVADAQFTEVTIDGATAWPYGPGTLGGVVIDGDAVAAGGNDGTLRRLLEEATRAAGPMHDVLVACTHRRVPRRLHAWREYGRNTARVWLRAAETLGLGATTAGFVRMDGDRVTDLLLPGDDPAGASAADRHADRIVLRVAASRQPETSAVSAIAAEARRRFGLAGHVDRVAVRKIGKSAVFLSAGTGQRCIIRIARSPIALARAQRNFEALEALHALPLPESTTQRIPAAIGRGGCAGYLYFVESCLDGRAGALSARAVNDGWHDETVQYLTALHMATVRRATLDAAVLRRFVHEPAARVNAVCDTPQAARVLQQVAAQCDGALGPRELPLVRAHGDFTASNCLYGPGGTLTGVVDWEVSMGEGLPLLDLLQLMPVAGESRPQPRWLRFDAWLALWRRPEHVIAHHVFGPYVRALALPHETIPALILMQWLLHVADRVEARRDDERWMQQRVWQPMETLEQVLA